MNIGKYFTPKVILNLSIIFGFLIFVGWVMTFLSGEISSKAEQISNHRMEINSRITAVSRLAELREAAKEAQPAIAELSTLLPTEEELVGFPRYLQNVANREGVNLSFSFQDSGSDEIDEGEIGASEFSMDALGSYNDIISFMEAVEKGDFIVSLSSVNITGTKNVSEFRANIRGVVYFRG